MGYKQLKDQNAGETTKPEDEDWQLQIEHYTAKKQDEDELKQMQKKTRKYYEDQNELIGTFEYMEHSLDDEANSDAHAKLMRRSMIMAQVSFFVNVLLFVGKSVAAALSGSLAVISTVVDSAVDLVSGGLMWWASKAIKSRDIYKYPQGRTRLEPISIVLVAVVMSLASVEVIWESIDQIMEYVGNHGKKPIFTAVPITICVVTVVTKLILYILCKRVDSPTCQTLAADHRNDVISNAGALICGYIGYKWWEYADPLGAIAISIYIIVSWFVTGIEQTRMLTGYTASPAFIKQITWMALNHHPSIQVIDTVRVFHFGINFLAEVDIVLPPEIPLKEAHDIGESLQQKIESIEEVERAFVHVDHECVHKPSIEHKAV